MVIPEEAKSRKGKLSVGETIKAAVLENNSGFVDLIVSSVYNTTSVYYLIMVSEIICWTEYRKYMYNLYLSSIEKLKFLQMSHINKYKKEIGNVGVTDQLKGIYWVIGDYRIENDSGPCYFGFWVQFLLALIKWGVELI